MNCILLFNKLILTIKKISSSITLCQECETFLMNLLKKNGKIDNKILKLKIEEKTIFKLL